MIPPILLYRYYSKKSQSKPEYLQLFSLLNLNLDDAIRKLPPKNQAKLLYGH